MAPGLFQALPNGEFRLTLVEGGAWMMERQGRSCVLAMVALAHSSPSWARRSTLPKY